MMAHPLDATDRAIINELQGGFPISEQPFADAAKLLGITEHDLIERVGALVDAGVLSRFGPMYNAERLGGAVTLCAMEIPAEELDGIAERVNSYREVAHNYARDHRFNMWFVLATESPDEIADAIQNIEADTGYRVYDFPKSREFYIGLKVPA